MAGNNNAHNSVWNVIIFQVIKEQLNFFPKPITRFIVHIKKSRVFSIVGENHSIKLDLFINKERGLIKASSFIYRGEYRSIKYPFLVTFARDFTGIKSFNLIFIFLSRSQIS